ncbi:MAG TPA: VCBS repeat-containing protein, partial [Polyangiaceae bacterium]|nr:VCBS repeat-containing protein [Polyangiaceae bacterium]
VLRGGIARQLVSPLVLRSGTALPAFATHEQVTSLEALVYGKFRSDHDARFVLAAMSARFGTDHRVELISSESGEQLVHWHATPFDCQAPSGPCPLWRLGAVDLDGDEVDSVVAFRNDELVVFTETTAPQIAQQFDTGFNLFQATRGEVHAAMVGKPFSADIDADGLEDVAVLGLGEVHILWNDGSGELSMDRYTNVASAEPILAFAFLQTQGDDRLELATVGAEGIELRTLDADHEFGAPLGIVDGPAGDILVAGDFSGDGVDDMVVGDALSFTLLFGESVEP